MEVGEEEEARDLYREVGHGGEDRFGEERERALRANEEASKNPEWRFTVEKRTEP